ncbi:type VII secretion protein EssA [Bacillus cytotoxicus]|nr:type VII secretion protein EssA [Bacillus cytotoxicus]
MKCIKQVKFSLVLFLFLSAALPIRSAADSYLNDNGKLEFKVDRVQQTNQERNEKGQQETELDKSGIELFNSEVEKQMKDKQMNEQKEMKELANSLFLNPKKIDNVKETEKQLFSKEYYVTSNGNEMDQSQTNTDSAISPVLIGLIMASIIFICVVTGIIIRKIWM